MKIICISKNPCLLQKENMLSLKNKNIFLSYIHKTNNDFCHTAIKRGFAINAIQQEDDNFLSPECHTFWTSVYTHV
jgi:hypothetical protein